MGFLKLIAGHFCCFAGLVDEEDDSMNETVSTFVAAVVIVIAANRVRNALTHEAMAGRATILIGRLPIV